MTPPSSRPVGRALRTAVIGAGAISLEHLAYLRTSPYTRIVGVADLSPIAGTIAARKFGAEASFTDVATMLAETRPDVVHVLTPPRSHGPLVRLALDAGAHVVCEKPMAPTGDEARALLDHASGAGRRLIESHNYRFNDGVQALLDLGSSDELGPIHEVDVRISLPVRTPGGRFADTANPDPIHHLPAGVIHDVITHLTYLLDHLARRPDWDQVMALWSNHGGGDLFTVDDLDALLIGHHGQGPVHGRIRFAANTFPDSFLLTIRGQGGQASTDLFHPYLETRRARRVGPQLTPIADHLGNGLALMRSGATNFGQKLLRHTPYHGLARFLDLTYEALSTDAEPPVTPRDILAAADLVDRMVESKGMVEARLFPDPDPDPDPGPDLGTGPGAAPDQNGARR